VAVSRSAATIKVYINDVLNNDIRVHSIDQVIGGSEVNTAVFEQLGVSTDIMVTDNNTLEGLAGQNNKVEIKIADQNGNDFTVFLGRVGGARVSIKPDGEVVTYTARLDPNMFGLSIASMACMNVNTLTGGSGTIGDFGLAYSEDDIIFNPIINGISQPNKTAADIVNGGSPFNGSKVFIDPRSIHPGTLNATINARSGVTTVVDTAVTLSGGYSAVSDYWSLREVVEYICKAINSNETYIDNPSRAELAAVLPQDGTQIRNLRIRRGAYLPELLDSVLNPYGYYWRVNFANPFGPRIEVAKRGLAGTVNLKRQAPGDVLNDSDTQLWQMNLNYDITNKTVSSNSAYGNEVIKEGTFELVPAWDITDPGDDVDVYANQPDIAGGGTSETGVAWRKWVLNEAGDYTDSWAGSWYAQNDWSATSRTAAIKAFDWDTFFGADAPNQTNHIKRRSRLLPTVTLNRKGDGPQGNTQGVYIEWGQYDNAAGQWIWRPVTGTGSDEDGVKLAGQEQVFSHGLGIGVRLLENEAGILFDDAPWDLKLSDELDQSSYSSFPRIRVTASLACDERVQDTELSADTLPVDTYGGAIDVTQFRHRAIATTGSYASVLWYGNEAAGNFSGSEAYKDGRIDDSTAIATYNANIVNSFNQATVAGTAVLNAVDYVSTDWIGLSVEKVEGLEFNLRTNANGLATATYPIITKVTLDIQTQTTVLKLGTT
tara:strand:- start:3811 stop:5949 length:2139 start_codon:yes stop_codon:yes gene_type:complete